MLRIVITPPVLTDYQITTESSKLDNPEWLRAMDRKNKTIYICPYYSDGYFRQQIIEPFLDENGEGFINEEMLGEEWYKDGINYVITSLYGSVAHQQGMRNLIEICKRANVPNNILLPRNNWEYKK